MSTPDRIDNAGKTPPIGVLLVHGMGQQERGDTLLGFGEPLYRWMNAWANKTLYPDLNGPNNVRLTETTLLRPSRPSLDAPPYMQMHLKWEHGPVGHKPGAGEQHELEFLIAESWWAKDFREVDFRQLFYWGVALAPWMFELYAARRWRLLGAAARELAGGPPGRADGSRYGIGGFLLLLLGALILTPLAVVASFVFQVALLALLVLALVPALRGLVAGFQAKLAGALGDPYLLATSPVRFDAMVSQVQRDLAWLDEEKGCRQIAVVAHSQGAVVAHEALREQEALQAAWVEKVQRFVTFGNPFAKLHLIRGTLPKQDYFLLKALWRYVGIGLVFVGLGWTWLRLDDLPQGLRLIREGRDRLQTAFDDLHANLPDLSGARNWVFDDWLLADGLVTLGLALFLTAHLWRHKMPEIPRLTPEILKLKRLGLPGGHAWRDFYAAADPFPDGPVLQATTPEQANDPVWQQVRSERVRNRDSVFQDHSTYWHNAEQFVGPIAYELVKMADQSFDRHPGDREHLAEAGRRRGARVDALRWSGWLAAAAVAVVWWGLWREGLRELAEWTGGVLQPILGLVPGVPDSVSEDLRAWFGLGLVALGGLLYHTAVTVPLWRRWDLSLSEQLFARTWQSWNRSRMIGFAIMAFLLSAGAGVVTALHRATPTAWLLAVALAALAFFLVALQPVLAARDRPPAAGPQILPEAAPSSPSPQG